MTTVEAMNAIAAGVQAFPQARVEELRLRLKLKSGAPDVGWGGGEMEMTLVAAMSVSGRLAQMLWHAVASVDVDCCVGFPMTQETGGIKLRVSKLKGNRYRSWWLVTPNGWVLDRVEGDTDMGDEADVRLLLDLEAPTMDAYLGGTRGNQEFEWTFVDADDRVVHDSKRLAPIRAAIARLLKTRGPEPVGIRVEATWATDTRHLQHTQVITFRDQDGPGWEGADEALIFNGMDPQRLESILIELSGRLLLGGKMGTIRRGADAVVWRRLGGG